MMVLILPVSAKDSKKELHEDLTSMVESAYMYGAYISEKCSVVYPVGSQDYKDCLQVSLEVVKAHLDKVYKDAGNK